MSLIKQFSEIGNYGINRNKADVNRQTSLVIGILFEQPESS
jgi:hypothetical protein